MLNEVSKESIASILLGLLIDFEDGREMFLRNFGCFSADYRALCPRRYDSS
jgi:hypothetical protein